uniref:Rod_C domain-containing protein n=1 Tax=Mesocestoides corti TaxID=53468 RepID=A0A5K3EUG7_MESCO
METTSLLLKAMHQEGAVPNDYIFSKILHGYVKCGLPDEVAATQDVMSKLNYWPSIMATEDLLSAYADVGDGSSVVELLQESLDKSESLLNHPIFSPRFLADLYTRLAMAPQFDANEQAAMKILSLLKQRTPGPDDYRIGIAVTRLFQTGHSSAAFLLLKNTRPHQFSYTFLSKIPELLSEQKSQFLNDFWMCSGSAARLPDLVRFMTMENAILTLQACYNLRQDLHGAVANTVVLKAVKENDVDSVVKIGNILGKQRLHLLYWTVIPRLLAMGLKPDEVVAKFGDPVSRSCAALGIVLNELCALPSFLNPPVSSSSLENAETLYTKFHSENLLPFADYLFVNNNSAHLLLRGCFHYCGEESGISQAKVDSWADLVFKCFTEDRHPLLASGLLQFCSEGRGEAPSKSDELPTPVSPRFASLTLNARQSLARALVTYFKSRRIPVSYLNLVKKNMEKLDMPVESTAGLMPAGNVSKHTSLVGRIHAGEISYVTEELQKMQKSISQETSPLGVVSQHQLDLLGEALSVSAPLPESVDSKQTSVVQPYSPEQLEGLFWALVEVAGLKKPSLSAAKICEQYLNASDMDGLVSFVKKVADRCPQNLSIIFSRWILQKAVQLDAAKAQKVMEDTLRNDAVTLPTMVLGAYNFAVARNEGGNANTTFELGVNSLAKRLEGLNQLRKVRTVHAAIEELCHNRQIFAAYALRDWACQLGLALLPQTTETLLASRVFIDSLPPIPAALLTPDRLTLRGGVSFSPLLSQLQEVSAAMTSDEGKSTAAIEAAANALSAHPFVTDPSALARTLRPAVFKKTQFAFWSAVGQTLETPGSQLSKPLNLARLAHRLVESGHEAAVHSWISCLLRQDWIAALCCGGLMSSKFNMKFTELLQCHPNLQFAVASSSAFLSSTPEQKDTVMKSFTALERAHLLTLSGALNDSDFSQAKSIIEKLPGDSEAVLSGLVNSRPNYLPMVAKIMNEQPIETQLSLVNRILEENQTRKVPMHLIFNLMETAAKPNLQEGEKADFACLKDRLSMSNQVFLRTLFKLFSRPRFMTQGFATGADYFQSIFPGNSNANLRDAVSKATRQGKPQALYDALVSIQANDPSKLREAASSVILSQLLISGHRNVMPILFSACHQRNSDLLYECAIAALPFLHNSLGVAFKGLADVFQQKELDPVKLEAINFHRLNEFTTPVVFRSLLSSAMSAFDKAQPTDAPKIQSLSLKFEKPVSDDVSDPIRLAKESVIYLANVLANGKLSDDNATIVVDMVRKLWGPGRVDLILCHLVDLRATKSVNQVIEGLPSELRERRLPFKALARLIETNSATSVSDKEQYNEAVNLLKTSPSQNLTSCMNGPHISTLFATWPESNIDDVIEVIKNTLGRFQTPLRLQLAASMVHRGLSERAAPIIEETGPLPFSYLAGSLQHPLSVSALRESIKYLKSHDLEHLPAFIDACLRNAAMSVRNGASTEEAVVELVEVAMEEPSLELRELCQPTTLKLLRETTKQSEKIQRALFDKTVSGTSGDLNAPSTKKTS